MTLPEPPLPQPLVLEDETFVIDDAGRVVLEAEDAETLLRNRAALLRWVSEAQSLIAFYRSRASPSS